MARDTFNVEVCSACRLDSHYPGENPREDELISWSEWDDVPLWEVADFSECDVPEHRNNDDYGSWADEHDECATIDFSPLACEGCGDTLAGTRHKMQVTAPAHSA